MGEYKSFFKSVGGNEGDKCGYSTRLDTYGCGCQFNCDYCYAKSLLNFRGLWHPSDPAVADIEKIKRRVSKLEPGSVVRMGGMTDCFAPIEREHKVTLETIKALNEQGVHYLIVTKSDLVGDDEYISTMDKDLAHVQVTVTCFDDDMYRYLNYEHAPLPSKRIGVIEKLYDNGFDVSIRVSPFIDEYVSYSTLNDVGCDKALVEFLRVNTWIEKWFDIDTSEYTVKENGYRHLPLEKKIERLSKITGKTISVCEDQTDAYNYWRENVNPNKEDCCNLRMVHDG